MMFYAYDKLFSHVWFFVTQWTAACQASLSITNSRNWLRLDVHQVGDAIQPSHPLLSPSPAFNLSFKHQGLFQWVSSSHQVAKGLELKLQHQPFQWIFRIDFLLEWLDLLAVQGTLKSLLQHHNSKPSVLRWSAFFIIQLSHSYMATGKTIALARRTIVTKSMSLILIHCLSLS